MPIEEGAGEPMGKARSLPKFTDCLFRKSLGAAQRPRGGRSEREGGGVEIGGDAGAAEDIAFRRIRGLESIAREDGCSGEAHWRDTRSTRNQMNSGMA